MMNHSSLVVAIVSGFVVKESSLQKQWLPLNGVYECYTVTVSDVTAELLPIDRRSAPWLLLVTEDLGVDAVGNLATAAGHADSASRHIDKTAVTK
jgi:hypothetical protein